MQAKSEDQETIEQQETAKQITETIGQATETIARLNATTE
jgi:hypothetical protein